MEFFSTEYESKMKEYLTSELVKMIMFLHNPMRLYFASFSAIYHFLLLPENFNPFHGTPKLSELCFTWLLSYASKSSSFQLLWCEGLCKSPSPTKEIEQSFKFGISAIFLWTHVAEVHDNLAFTNFLSHYS